MKTLGLVVLALAISMSVAACEKRNAFTGTWSGASGRAVIDATTVTFYDASGQEQGQWAVTVVDDTDARIDTPLGAGSLTLHGDVLEAKSGGLTYDYRRAS